MEFAADVPVLWIAVLVAVLLVVNVLRDKAKGKETNGEELDLLDVISQWGLSELFGGLTKKTIAGDRSGAKAETKNTVTQLIDDTRALPALEKNFYVQLPKRLDNPEQFARIARMVDDARAAKQREAKLEAV